MIFPTHRESPASLKSCLASISGLDKEPKRTIINVEDVGNCRRSFQSKHIQLLGSDQCLNGFDKQGPRHPKLLRFIKCRDNLYSLEYTEPSFVESMKGVCYLDHPSLIPCS